MYSADCVRHFLRPLIHIWPLCKCLEGLCPWYNCNSFVWQPTNHPYPNQCPVWQHCCAAKTNCGHCPKNDDWIYCSYAACKPIGCSNCDPSFSEKNKIKQMNFITIFLRKFGKKLKFFISKCWRDRFYLFCSNFCLISLKQLFPLLCIRTWVAFLLMK